MAQEWQVQNTVNMLCACVNRGKTVANASEFSSITDRSKAIRFKEVLLQASISVGTSTLGYSRGLHSWVLTSYDGGNSI